MQNDVLWVWGNAAASDPGVGKGVFDLTVSTPNTVQKSGSRWEYWTK